jgi:hypothetical protein
VKFDAPPIVEISVSELIELNVIIQYKRRQPEVPVEFGAPLGHPSRRLRAILRDNLLGQIDEGAQARGHVTAS